MIEIMKTRNQEMETRSQIQIACFSQGQVQRWFFHVFKHNSLARDEYLRNTRSRIVELDQECQI